MEGSHFILVIMDVTAGIMLNFFLHCIGPFKKSAFPHRFKWNMKGQLLLLFSELNKILVNINKQTKLHQIMAKLK